MLIARITGGIGNQLFQYAFVRSLALKLDIKFKMDLSWYLNYDKYEDPKDPNAATKREYLLDKFKISEKIINQNYFRVSHRLNNSSIFKKIKNVPLVNKFRFDIMNENEFDINSIQSSENLYLRGFWQKQDIFEEYSNILREEFTLKNSLSSENQIYLDKINASKSVAVHFRRGDLLNRPVAVMDQPSSTDQYYTNAISIINEKVNDPELFIFSDDISWIENNYTFDLPVTYINTDGPDYEHFNLMCHCKHDIIVNSTFSWWAAWLNQFNEKIIIAPKWWYRDPDKNDRIIRIPKEWLILENLEK